MYMYMRFKNFSRKFWKRGVNLFPDEKLLAIAVEI